MGWLPTRIESHFPARVLRTGAAARWQVLPPKKWKATMMRWASASGVQSGCGWSASVQFSARSPLTLSDSGY
jgi:hypothetical protein